MWIELPDDLIEYTKKITNPLDKSIISINTLFDSMIKCQHIVYGSIELLRSLENHNLVNQTNKKFISWIRQKYIYVYECYDSVRCKVIVSTIAKSIEKNDSIFIVPLCYFFKIRETKLLAENESDAELFVNIFHQMQIIKKLSKYFTVCFENDSFHGGNVSSKMYKAVEQEQIMVCLVDSDKDYRGSRSGSTYRGANAIYKKEANNHLISMKQLNVREKENLIPPKMYLVISDQGDNLLKVMQNFINDNNTICYFDIKDGVKYEKLINKKWIKVYKEVIDKCIETNIYIEPADDLRDRNKFICVAGIGAHLCDVVNDVILECSSDYEKNIKKHSISKARKSEILACRNRILDYLPDYLLDEWNQIYDLLFSWGCCLSESLNPIYNLE